MSYLAAGGDLLAVAEVGADGDVALEAADGALRLERDVLQIRHVLKLLELVPGKTRWRQSAPTCLGKPVVHTECGRRNVCVMECNKWKQLLPSRVLQRELKQ